MRCPRGSGYIAGYIIFPPSSVGLHLASELSWMVIPIVVFPRSPPPMTMVRVLGFELVGIRDVPVGIEAL